MNSLVPLTPISFMQMVHAPHHALLPFPQGLKEVETFVTIPALQPNSSSGMVHASPVVTLHTLLVLLDPTNTVITLAQVPMSIRMVHVKPFVIRPTTLLTLRERMNVCHLVQELLLIGMALVKLLVILPDSVRLLFMERPIVSSSVPLSQILCMMMVLVMLLVHLQVLQNMFNRLSSQEICVHSHVEGNSCIGMEAVEHLVMIHHTQPTL